MNSCFLHEINVIVVGLQRPWVSAVAESRVEPGTDRNWSSLWDGVGVNC